MGSWFKSDPNTSRTSRQELKQHELDYGELFMRYLKEKKAKEAHQKNRVGKATPAPAAKPNSKGTR